MRRIYFSKNLLKYRVSKNRGVYFPLFGKIIYGIIRNFRGIPEKFFKWSKEIFHDSKNNFSKEEVK